MSTFENFMDRAWSLALARLSPSSTDLQHGLELHRALPVCDNYAFLPKVFTSRLTEKMNGLQERGVGVIEWRQKSWAHRVTACLDDAGGASEFFAALDRADVCGLVQNVSDVGESLEYALMNIASHQRVCTVLKERVFQATSADDFLTARENGKTGVMFSLTGLPLSGSMADPDALLDWVDVWYNMGVRFMHMGYNRRNLVADGCTEARDGGLSDFGRDLVRRLNEAGITVDVPHSSPLTTEDVVAYSSKPVIATHIGCQAIFDHPRCKSDKEIKQIAGTGGLVGIYALPSLLGPDADINLMLKHVRHAVELVGADHVAIGTDISYIADWPEDIRPYPMKQNISDRIGGRNSEHTRHRSCDHLGGTLSWTNWPLFTTGLVQMGLRDGDIEKLLGGNLRRVLRANRPAHELEALAVLENLKSKAPRHAPDVSLEIPVAPVRLNGKQVATNGASH
jgi:membrane dipeptidase